jgi:hypothetical protein
MSLSDLRKELKELRKKAMPTPVSRMKKADCASELARLKGLHGKEEVAVKEALVEEKVSKKAVKKVEAVQKVSHKKEEEVLVPSKYAKKAEPKPEAKSEAKSKKAEAKPVAKPAKGSEEMRDRMKKLREMRKAKSDE